MSADAEITNYKSGISLFWKTPGGLDGVRGVDFAEENLYFDKVVCDRKVVYIKAATLIAMEHNERNVAGLDGTSPTSTGSTSYESVGLDVGVIKYKVDGDQSWMRTNALVWSAYSAPISFAGLNYGLFGASGTPVVGNTGRVGTLTRETKETTYYRGMLDSLGEEYHLLTVADDDSARFTHDEWSSSDGKVFIFVVNPKTPCLTFRVTGSGQFWTSDPKKYFIPKIYAQQSYIDAGPAGTVSVEISDINGNNIFYRINGGSFTNAGASSVILPHTAFSDGANTLEYYYAGNAAYTKTRTITKNPVHPSASETHGDRMWVNATYWENDTKLCLNGTKPNTYNNRFNAWAGLSHNAANYRNGKRNDGNGMEDALVARYYGMARCKGVETIPNSQWAKRSLFEFIAAVDPVGMECNSGVGACPAREWFERGYTDMINPSGAATTYDIIAGYYRRDQGYADGLTPCEDFYIRNAFAIYIHTCACFMAGYVGPLYDYPNSTGMWEISKIVAGAYLASVMPSYSSEIYGTCGLDGNTATYYDCPFPDVKYTWQDLLIKDTIPNTGFPNKDKHVGVEQTMLNDPPYSGFPGIFNDRRSYTATSLMGHVMLMWWNLQKLHNGVEFDFTKAVAYISQGVSGTLYGGKNTKAGDTLPTTRVCGACLNAWFPDTRATGTAAMLAAAGGTENSWQDQLYVGGPYYSIWMQSDLPGYQQVAEPEFNPAPGGKDAAVSVTLSTTTIGAEIRYTLNGGAPNLSSNLYTAPIELAADTTIRAIAILGGSVSTVSTGAYQINILGVPTPPVITFVGPAVA